MAQSSLSASTTAAFNLLLAHITAISRSNGTKPIVPSPPQRDLYSCAIYLHNELSKRNVPYYFCGGFACINVGMTARTTSDIDIAVPNGPDGFGVLLNILSRAPFIQDKTGVLPRGSYYFFVQSSGTFVEIDGIMAGFMGFPTFDPAKIVQTSQQQLQLKFLEPSELLRLKFSTWANETRRKGPKRQGDISDILSIRHLLVSSGKSMDLKGLQGEFARGLRGWVQEFNDLGFSRG